MCLNHTLDPHVPHGCFFLCARPFLSCSALSSLCFFGCSYRPGTFTTYPAWMRTPEASEVELLLPPLASPMHRAANENR